VKGVGEPCAGEPHARFDGRGLETERTSVTAPAPDPTNLQSRTRDTHALVVTYPDRPRSGGGGGGAPKRTSTARGVHASAWPDTSPSTPSSRMSRAFTLAGFRGSGDDETMPVARRLASRGTAVIGAGQRRRVRDVRVGNEVGPHPLRCGFSSRVRGVKTAARPQRNGWGFWKVRRTYPDSRHRGRSDRAHSRSFKN